MAIKYGFFNSKNHDREKYSAESFRAILKDFVHDGIQHDTNKFYVEFGGSVIRIASGFALFDNIWFYNDDYYYMEITSYVNDLTGIVNLYRKMALCIYTDSQDRRAGFELIPGDKSFDDYSDPVIPESYNKHYHIIAYLKFKGTQYSIDGVVENLYEQGMYKDNFMHTGAETFLDPTEYFNATFTGSFDSLIDATNAIIKSANQDLDSYISESSSDLDDWINEETLEVTTWASTHTGLITPEQGMIYEEQLQQIRNTRINKRDVVQSRLHLNDAAKIPSSSVVYRTLTSKSIDGGTPVNATLNITSVGAVYHNKQVLIKSDVIDTPIIITLSASGTAIVPITLSGKYILEVEINGKNYYTIQIVRSNLIYDVVLSEVKLVTWSNGTDSEIVNIINAIDNGSLSPEDIGWAVGEERTIRLNALPAGENNVAQPAQINKLVIMEIGSYNGVGHFVIGFKHLLQNNEYLHFNLDEFLTTPMGWHESRGRLACNAIFDMIPSTLQPAFKQFSVYAANKSSSDSSGVTESQNSKLSLFSEKELFDARTYSARDEFNSDKHHQIEYFKVSDNRISKRYGDKELYTYLLRSPCNSSYYIDGVGDIQRYCGTINATSDLIPVYNAVPFRPFGVM